MSTPWTPWNPVSSTSRETAAALSFSTANTVLKELQHCLTPRLTYKESRLILFQSPPSP